MSALNRGRKTGRAVFKMKRIYGLYILIALPILYFIIFHYWPMYWNPRISYTEPGTGTILHYKHPDHYIGDVHPYFENGKYYLYYLMPGSYSPALSTSTDMLNWDIEALTRPTPDPYQNYYVLKVLKDRSTYRSYYGNFNVLKVQI